MTDRAQAGGQAPSQGQSGQAPQSQAQGQPDQAMTTELFGQAPAAQQQGQQADAGTADFPGIKAGETPAQYVARMQRDLAEARQQAGKYRTELRTKVGDTTPNAEGKTEFQILQEQLGRVQSDLEAERQARKADKSQAQVVNALAEAGAVSPARCVKLLDFADGDIGADGSITPEALAHAVATLKAEMPQVFTDTRGSGDGGAGNGGYVPPVDFNEQIRARARR